jgi:heat shock protein HtpX
MAKRILLFVVVNALILVTISIVLSVLGVRPYLTESGIDYSALMVFCLIWGMGGAFISLALSRIMAKWMMGVQVIDPATSDPTWAELVRTVHHLARSAGLSKMPEVGVYDSPELNAFATGPTRNRSLVAVSTGLLRQMHRDEVKGVLGHEVAHIANGDMVTMTLIQGVVNAFVLFFARIIAYAISQRVSSEMRWIVHLVSVIVFQILFSILGMIVVAWFSRWREYRADNGGATLAGRQNMVNALRALSRNVVVHDDRQAAVATLKISPTSRSGLLKLISTHPPLEERIKRLQATNV